jgi:hypothetical protein
MEFEKFPKIARLSREIIVTEKIDGTNGCICIKELEGYVPDDCLYSSDGLALWAGSRSRFIAPQNDNHGFAKWALANAEELLMLGPGRHFGEWWGSGIQRGYGLPKGEKRFSLFNVSRWADDSVRPKCCHVVPILYQGNFDTEWIKIELDGLTKRGSKAAPGFMNPEGIVIYHTAANVMFKKTIKNDEKGKGE